MTRIFTDGAERGDNLFWDYLIGGAVITGGANTADFRSGAWGYRFPHSSSNGNGYKIDIVKCCVRTSQGVAGVVYVQDAVHF